MSEAEDRVISAADTGEDFEKAVEKTIKQVNQLQRQTSEELADVAVLI